MLVGSAGGEFEKTETTITPGLTGGIINVNDSCKSIFDSGMSREYISKYYRRVSLCDSFLEHSASRDESARMMTTASRDESARMMTTASRDDNRLSLPDLRDDIELPHLRDEQQLERTQKVYSPTSSCSSGSSSSGSSSTELPLRMLRKTPVLAVKRRRVSFTEDVSDCGGEDRCGADWYPMSQKDLVGFDEKDGDKGGKRTLSQHLETDVNFDGDVDDQVENGKSDTDSDMENDDDKVVSADCKVHRFHRYMEEIISARKQGVDIRVNVNFNL